MLAVALRQAKASRDRKRVSTGKVEGRKSHAERDPGLVALARQLAAPPPGYARRPSLRKVAGELAARGYVTSLGKPYSASAVQSMLGE
jgi:hypothetical protein